MGHTPGPWRIGKSYAEGEIAIRNGNDMEECLAVVCSINEVEPEANAQLISAAPELLEACKLAHEIAFFNQHVSGMIALAEICRKAIAKAEGGENNELPTL